MWEKILKFLVLLGVIVAIPVIDYYLITGGVVKGARAYLWTFGASFFLLGLCYRLLGKWDLIPDWVPFLGKADDTVAWVGMLGGVALVGLGFAF